MGIGRIDGASRLDPICQPCGIWFFTMLRSAKPITARGVSPRMERRPSGVVQYQIASLCSTPMELRFNPLLSRFEPRSFFFQASRCSESDNAAALYRPTRPSSAVGSCSPLSCRSWQWNRAQNSSMISRARACACARGRGHSDSVSSSPVYVS
jgi:hypothetical protein